MYLFLTTLLLFLHSISSAQVMLPAYQGVLGRKQITTGNGLTSANASSTAYKIKQDFPSSTDGIYWIKNANINGNVPFQIYADMNTDGGGWMLLNASGGNVASTQVATLTSSESTGYLPRASVIELAKISTIVQLRSGPASNKFANVTTSSDSKPIAALMNTATNSNGQGTWHNNLAFSSFQVKSGSWIWINASGLANGWPNMFHSSGNASAVHWLPTYADGSGRNWASGEYFSTWIK